MIYFITHTNYYKNYGDLAIDLATFIQFEVNDIKYKIINEYSKNLPKITNDDILCIRGGGFFGLYNGIPEKFLKKFLQIPCKKRILLPSSLYFNNDLTTINDIKNLPLIIFARDDVSYMHYKKHFVNSKIYKCQDMVFTFEKDTDMCDNETFTMIARGTERKHLDLQKIKNCSHFSYVNNINWQNKSKGEMLNEFLKFKREFKKNKYIITDSLHCCIFSYIFNRYCFAYDNKYGKVHNTINSYFQNANVKLCNTKEDLNSLDFSNKTIKFNFDNIINELKN